MSGRRYVVLMGPPGAGKGTQAARLAEAAGLCRISTGDLLRAAQAAGTPLGRQAAAIMATGELVPDEVILELVDEELDREACSGGAVFDGFPRTVEQARGLDRLLRRRDARLGAVIVITVPDDEVVRRLSGRRVCQDCEKLYHIRFDPSRAEGRCDACGGELIQRSDDEPETIRHRLVVYREETEPVIQFYRLDSPPENGVVEVDGDRPIGDVATAIREALDTVETSS